MVKWQSIPDDWPEPTDYRGCYVRNDDGQVEFVRGHDPAYSLKSIPAIALYAQDKGILMIEDMG